MNKLWSYCIPIALANDTGSMAVVLGNELEIDQEGWALIAPFGEHLKSRLIRNESGDIVEQKFIQVLDNEAADTILSGENTMFRKLKRALFGITVYKGHPDLKQHAPETVDLSGGPKKVALGVADKLRKGTRGIEAHFSLLPDEAQAVENEGYKYPSALWLVQPIGERDGAIVCKPFKLLSVGLTPNPNISGVDSLANAKSNTPAAKLDAESNETMKALLIGWLAAKGIVLANDASEQAVFEAFQRHQTSTSTEVTTLGNDKTTLSGQITTLQNEKTTLGGQVTALTNERTNLTNQVTALTNDKKTERKGRAEAVVDLVIHQGRLAIAERDAQITALENSADFDKDAKALKEKAVQFKVGSQNAESSKALANATTPDPRATLLQAVDQKMKDTGSSDYAACHAAVMKENPSLAAQLKTRTNS
jgi:hypothetical protein